MFIILSPAIEKTCNKIPVWLEEFNDLFSWRVLSFYKYHPDHRTSEYSITQGAEGVMKPPFFVINAAQYVLVGGHPFMDGLYREIIQVPEKTDKFLSSLIVAS